MFKLLNCFKVYKIFLYNKLETNLHQTAAKKKEKKKREGIQHYLEILASDKN